MSYYSDTTKKVRRENALLAMRLGCPEGALTVPGHPIAYYVSGGTPGEPGPITLTTYRWSPSGKCTARAWELTRGHGDYSTRFEYVHEVFAYHFPSGSLCVKMGSWHWHPMTEPTRNSRLLAAYTMFKGVSVRMPSTAAKGDTVEASRRGYVRRQANALLKHMPDGFALVPGCERTAYRVFNITGRMMVKLVAATTKAHTLERHDARAIKFTDNWYYGVLTVEGKDFKLDGMRLVPASAQQPYPPEFEQYARALRNDAFEQAAEACRPFGKTGAAIAAAIRNKLTNT